MARNWSGMRSGSIAADAYEVIDFKDLERLSATDRNSFFRLPLLLAGRRQGGQLFHR
jgi:hypothetical protein